MSQLAQVAASNGHAQTETATIEPREAALQLAAEGLPVFPCHSATDGCSCAQKSCSSPGKHPRTARGFKDASVERTQIEEWWRRWPDANIGIATGGTLLVVDIDGHDAEAGLAELAEAHGGLPHTRTVRTGRDGGRHLWFRVPSGVRLGNTSGRLAPGIDTRGDGGYVLAPPSRHPSGRVYAYEDAQAVTAEAPAWLVERLSAPRTASPTANEMPATPDAHRLAAYAEAALKNELAKLDAHSTEPGTGRGTALFASAAALGRFVNAGTLPLVETWGALTAAGERLGLAIEEVDRNVTRGLELGRTEPAVLDDRPRTARSQQHRIDGRPSAGERDQSGAAESDDSRPEWPRLPRFKPPKFPLDSLPPRVASFVRAVAEETQTPPDLAALAALGVLSAAALGAAVVDCGSWEEELALYILVSLRTGERKSAALRSVVAPLHELEREWRADSAASVRERLTQQEALQARKAKLVRKVGEIDDADQRDAAQTELTDVAERLDAIGEPVVPRLLADDATPEALAKLLAHHGRLAILAAEAPFIDNLIGRYDAKGTANLHLVCHAYHGEYTTVDRRGRDTEQLDRPLLTIALTVQPHVLQALIEHPLARAQGLVGRFAYADPPSRLGRRRIDAPPVPKQLHDDWREVVRHVSTRNPLTELTELSSVSSVSTPERRIEPLSLCPPAKSIFDALRAEQEPRLAEDGDLRAVDHWIARHPGRVARIAGVLHLASQHGGDAQITEETMRGALRIGEYLLAHGLATLTAPDESLRHALDWLASRQQDVVSRRDLQRGPLGSRGTAAEAEELAQKLTAAGALRPCPPPPPRPGQPPSPRYEINPHIRRPR